MFRRSERDEKGNIIGLLGLSQRDRPHKFVVNGKTLTTWYAWDSLFQPLVIDQAARVKTSCPLSNTKISLSINPRGVEDLSPSTAVLSIVVPKPTSESCRSVQEIWKEFCCHVRFFRSAEVTAQWFSDRTLSGRVLSVEDGFELGRKSFTQILECIEPAA